MGDSAELLVVVPSRGRPHTVPELVEAFAETCAADTWLLFAVDESDPTVEHYVNRALDRVGGSVTVACRVYSSSSMVEALNFAVLQAVGQFKDLVAVGFLGDDHRPRTKGWDRAYLDALKSSPGIVYGNDLFQGGEIPTQCAMSASWVRALGFMAAPVLTHLYVDNYWLTLGKATGCITYLPDVVVEHVHPLAGKAEWDVGYARVNTPEMYQMDRLAFESYWREFGQRDVQAVLGVGTAR